MQKTRQNNMLVNAHTLYRCKKNTVKGLNPGVISKQFEFDCPGERSPEQDFCC